MQYYKFPKGFHPKTEFKKGQDNPNYGKPAWNSGKVNTWMIGDKNQSKRQEVRIKISEIKKQLYGEKKIINPMYGKHHSKETREKISKTRIERGYKGEKCPNWRGGVTSETIKRCSELFWKKLRKMVYQRDNFTCQKCGKHEGKLQCHHIVPFRINEDNSMNNLITLCIACHRKSDWNKSWC